MRNRFPIPFFLCALLAATVGMAQGFGDSYAKVAVAPLKEAPAGRTFGVTVSFEIDEGIHVYKKSIEFTGEELVGAKYLDAEKPTGKVFADATSAEPGAMTEAYEGKVDVILRFQATGAEGDPIAIRGAISYQGCKETTCFAPMAAPIAVELTTVAATGEPGKDEPPVPDAEETAAPKAKKDGTPAGAGFILFCFVVGLGLSLTPCVYPLIPITLAIIGGKQKEHKLAAIGLSAVYVLGIAITYAVIGVLVAQLGGSVRLVFQSPWFLVPIGGVFVLLALAMFDVITIESQAASGLADKVRGKSSGVMGVLLLGMVSGLVAGPCVAAPLLAVLVKIAETGDSLFGATAMFVMAWGMGIILVVAGASTSLLPKAGAWMNWVKHLFGFVILWAAVYFLRPIIGEVAFALGTGLLILSGAVFLGGFDSLTAESGAGARVIRLLGFIALFAALWFGFEGLQEAGVVRLSGPAPAAEVLIEGDLASVDAALGAGTPVFLDFTADWCTYCKVIKRTTLADARVVSELRRFRAFEIDLSDVTQHKELRERYKVVGPPAYLVFNSKGELLHELGYEDLQQADPFVALLQKVK
ncbi:protein-disulfide reductase DsbD [bacterium]|nr:protein-disulfide reductase DsbD [bacterium]